MLHYPFLVLFLLEAVARYSARASVDGVSETNAGLSTGLHRKEQPGNQENEDGASFLELERTSTKISTKAGRGKGHDPSRGNSHSIWEQLGQAASDFVTPNLAEVTFPPAFTLPVKNTATGERVNLNMRMALEPLQHQRGLMFREHPLPPDEGMIFVYGTPAKRVFWMKDTLIDLDATWWDADGKLLERPITMYKNDLTYRWSESSNAQYGIELKPGALDDLGMNAPGHVSFDMAALQRQIQAAREQGASGMPP